MERARTWERWWRVGAAVLALAVGVRAGHGQAAPPPAAVTAPEQGHGWCTLEDEEPGTLGSRPVVRTVLMHLPPRGGVEEGAERRTGGKPTPGGYGTRAVVTAFDGRVDRLAWSGASVYVAMAPEPAPGGDDGVRVGGPAWVRRVMTLRAEHLRGRAWVYSPERPEVLPSLDGDPELVGLAAMGTAEGAPVALLRERLRADELRPPLTTLWVLTRSGWSAVDPPWRLAREDAPLAPTWRRVQAEGEAVPRWEVAGLLDVIPWRGGFAVVMTGAEYGRLEAWVGRPAVGPPAPRREGAGAVTVEPLLAWERQAFPLTAMRNGVTEGLRPDRLAFVPGLIPAEDVLLGVTFYPASAGGPEGAEVHLLRPGGGLPLADLPGVPRRAQVVAMGAPTDVPGGTPTLALAWSERLDREGRALPPGSAERGTAGLALREISALTGRSLYDGLSTGLGWGSPREYQALAVLLFLTMAGVLVFVLRGDAAPGAEGGLPALPEGAVIADPVRRLAAAVLDYVPAAVGVGMAMGRGPTALLNPEIVVGREPDLLPVAVTLGVCATACVLGEWLFGRSLGKYVVGLRVIAVNRAVGGAGAGSQQGGRGAGGQGSGKTGDRNGGAPVGYTRPRLWQAVVRNYVRWAAPVVAVFALFDEARRHPADIAARTLVVMAAGEEEV